MCRPLFHNTSVLRCEAGSHPQRGGLRHGSRQPLRLLHQLPQLIERGLHLGQGPHARLHKQAGKGGVWRGQRGMRME